MRPSGFVGLVTVSFAGTERAHSISSGIGLMLGAAQTCALYFRNRLGVQEL